MREIDLGDFLMACRQLHQETGTVVSFGSRGELFGVSFDYNEEAGMFCAEDFLMVLNSVVASRSMRSPEPNPCSLT